jgi:cytochrome c biogenesis protein CcmG, thiol:disulfide interchange protein DsbE
MVWRHVGEIGARHRFSAAATGEGCTGGHECREQDDREALHHNRLSLRLTARVGKRDPGTDVEIPIHDFTLLPPMSCSFDAFSREIFRPARYALIAFVVIAAVVASASGRARAAPHIGEEAPPLVLATIGGSIIDLAKLRGKVVMVNYWATWCAPCRKEMPKLDAFYRLHHDQGLEIIGISIDFERDLEKARKAARAVSYPTAVAKDITNDGFGIPKGVPITWIIDVDGKVRDRFIDVRDELLTGIVVPLLPH